jgi:hypothetical protein
MGALAVMLAAVAAPPALARPRLVSFACHVDGRTRSFLPAPQERDSYDELLCRVSVAGLGGRSPGDLAVELRLLPPDGSYRVVATSPLEPADAGRGQARIDELVVPHASWVAGLDRRDPASPRLRLELRLLDRPSPGSRSWRLVDVRPLELGARRKSAPLISRAIAPSRRGRKR